MTTFPSPFTEEWVTINNKEEPIVTFLSDKVTPFFREEDKDFVQYPYTNSRLSMAGYAVADFDKEIMQIHKVGEKHPVFCRTAMLVGMSKATWGDENFAQCIEAMFVQVVVTELQGK